MLYALIFRLKLNLGQNMFGEHYIYCINLLSTQPGDRTSDSLTEYNAQISSSHSPIVVVV
ncbi:MAG: hypothetical protein RLZZ04_1708 [Cyanobacteriota bacterium]|jgi:hypothetical protein